MLIIESNNFARYVYEISTDPEVKKSANILTSMCEKSLSEIERYRKDQKK